MSSVLDKAAPKRVQPSALIGARLPKWAPYGAGVAAIAVALGMRGLLDWTGWGTSFWMAAVLFIVGFTAWSFAVEGKRRAKDRFASTLIYITRSVVKNFQHRHNTVGGSVCSADIGSGRTNIMDRQPNSTGRLRYFRSLLQRIINPIDTVVLHRQKETR